ncbi:MAG: hypothetical protein K2K97_07180, partial [Muribaculaceae bacterium]|nr:hypothetical protein [Muribaculaceae bacterium]
MFHLLPVTRQVFEVKFVEVTNKRSDEETESARSALLKYCKKHYPIHQFSIEPISVTNIDNEFPALLSRVHAELIAVPNKKKNIFARFFNPGLAHRLLFSADIPMLVLPV